MLPAEVITKKNADLIAFAKEELKDKCPSDVDSMERPVLIELVKGILEKKAMVEQEAERAAPGSAAAPASVDTDKLTSDSDALEALRVMGFDSKAQVQAYLKAVEREKEQQKTRIAAIEKAHQELDAREVKLKKREADIDAKGKQVGADLAELKKMRTDNAKAREALSKL